MDSYTYITLASNDPTVPPGSTPASFTNSFQVPVQLGNVETEVALFSMSFKPPNGTDVVFVNASIVEQTVVVGSQRTNALRRIVVDATGQVVGWESPRQLQFVNANVSTVLSTVELSLTDENGNILVCDPASVTFVTLALRARPITKIGTAS